MQYKHSGTFANSKQGRTALPQKMCDPILVTLLKMRPHCSQSSREMRSHPAAHPHYWPLRRKYPLALVSILSGLGGVYTCPQVELKFFLGANYLRPVACVVASCQSTKTKTNSTPFHTRSLVVDNIFVVRFP